MREPYNEPRRKKILSTNNNEKNWNICYGIITMKLINISSKNKLYHDFVQPKNCIGHI